MKDLIVGTALLTLSAITFCGCGSQPGDTSDPDLGSTPSAIVLASMPSSRVYAASCVITDNNGTDNLFTVGGYDSTGFLHRDSMIYDPFADTWTAKASLPVGAQVSDAQMISIPGTQKCLLVGGNNTPTITTNAAYIYDWTSDTWTATPTLSQSRAYHRLSVCGTGTGSSAKIIAFGGVTAAGVLREQIEVWSAATNTWARLQDASLANVDMTFARSSFGLAADGSKFFVAGGNTGVPTATMELFTVNSTCGAATHSVATTNLRVSRDLTVAIPQGTADTFIIAGGTSTGSNALSSSDQVLVTNWTTGAVTVSGTPGSPGGPSMTTARRDPQLVRTSSSQLAVAGGLDASGTPLTAVQKWSTSLKVWRPQVNFFTARDSFIAEYLPSEAKAVAAGGNTGSGVSTAVEDF